jgi:predicted nucleotidyltransferase component of viral defense system
MLISEHDLRAEAKQRGYRPEILEKVYHLLDLLELFMDIPYLQRRLVLKGGTAINLFCSDQLPRLSLDIDLNYINACGRDEMVREKQELESIILDVLRRRRYELHRHPRAHAGGKMVLVYRSALGNKGRLELDINYILRVPLWSPELRQAPPWLKSIKVAVLDPHELAAGKLQALFGRIASRDLFDSHRILTEWQLDVEKLRLAFTVYTAMRYDGWRDIKIDNINFNVKDIRDKLFPVLKQEHITATAGSIEQWAVNMLNETKVALGRLLPFNINEIEFLDCLRKRGEIRPELISGSQDFCDRVKRHPSLLWRVKQNNLRVG